MSLLLSMLISFFSLLPGQAKVNPRDLALPYQEFLKLTTYLIKEK